MTSKVSCWVVLCLVILLADFPVQSRRRLSYRDFAHNHIDHPKTRASNINAYCNLMMRRRGMTKPRCSPLNTFIITLPRNLQAICRKEGTLVDPKQNFYDSKRRFHIINCENTGHYPNCQYIASRENKRMRVACENRLPVRISEFLP